MHRYEQYNHKPFPAMPVTWSLAINFLSYTARGDGKEHRTHESNRSGVHRLSFFRQQADVFVFAFTWFFHKSQTSTTAYENNGVRGNLSQATFESARQGTPHIPVSATECGHCQTGSGVEHRYHLSSIIQWFCLSGGIYRLVQPLCIILRSIDNVGSPLLSFRIGSCIKIRKSGSTQFRSGRSIYLPYLHRCSIECRYENQYGRQGAGTGQCVCRAPVAQRQIRRYLSQRVCKSTRCGERITRLFQFLQLRSSTSIAQRKSSGRDLRKQVTVVPQETSGGRMGGHIPPIPPLNTKYINKKNFTKTPFKTSQFATLRIRFFCPTNGVHLLCMGFETASRSSFKTHVLYISYCYHPLSFYFGHNKYDKK